MKRSNDNKLINLLPFPLLNRIFVMSGETEAGSAEEQPAEG